MPLALLDTNAVSDMMANHPQFQSRASAFSSTMLTNTIVRGEVYYGIERLPVGKKRADLETRAKNAFASLVCVPLRKQVADVYGRIRALLEAQGFNLNDNDLWIAATALTLRAVLVTRDQVFKHVLGLQVEDWTV